MASCGPPPPRAAATPAAAATTAQHVLLQHSVLPQNTLLQHLLSSKENASTSSNILAAASHATAAAVLIPGTYERESCCNVRSENVPCLGLLHEVTPGVRSRDEPGQERHAACVAETPRSVVCTPTTVPMLGQDICTCLLYTSPSPRDLSTSRMPSSA